MGQRQRQRQEQKRNVRWKGAGEGDIEEEENWGELVRTREVAEMLRPRFIFIFGHQKWS